jgi:hypothetical protein
MEGSTSEGTLSSASLYPKFVVPCTLAAALLSNLSSVICHIQHRRYACL